MANRWQTRYVKKVHHRNDFDTNENTNDIAILEFNIEFDLKPADGRIVPVCLPTKQYKEGDDTVVSGWGQINGTVLCYVVVAVLLNRI